MSGNGAIARVRVENHLIDDVAEAKERLIQLGSALDDAVRLYQLDKADDPIQVENIERLRRLKDDDLATIARLQRQIKAVQEGRTFDNEPVRVPVGS